MKKNRAKQQNVATSQEDLSNLKPYGFCCVKDQDRGLLELSNVSTPVFPSSGPIGEGPDVKIRIQEADDGPRTKRGAQRRRSGQRIGIRGAGFRDKYRDRDGEEDDWGDQVRSRGRRRIGFRRGKPVKPSGERMKCKRCRGPLKWYLEDEISAAIDIMTRKRQEKYDAEMEKNIKAAKAKEKRRRKGKRSKSKLTEDTVNEDTTEEDMQQKESKYMI